MASIMQAAAKRLGEASAQTSLQKLSLSKDHATIASGPASAWPDLPPPPPITRSAVCCIRPGGSGPCPTMPAMGIPAAVLPAPRPLLAGLPERSPAKNTWASSVRCRYADVGSASNAMARKTTCSVRTKSSRKAQYASSFKGSCSGLVLPNARKELTMSRKRCFSSQALHASHTHAMATGIASKLPPSCSTRKKRWKKSAAVAAATVLILRSTATRQIKQPNCLRTRAAPSSSSLASATRTPQQPPPLALLLLLLLPPPPLLLLLLPPQPPSPPPLLLLVGTRPPAPPPTTLLPARDCEAAPLAGALEEEATASAIAAPGATAREGRNRDESP
mmetsp:Transcript_53734/g.152279  ORF Transcript_53734/g.152279 Transcript_53734/m.152279 type:complete len:333 (-) Transcript_53734:2-1000(-)